MKAIERYILVISAINKWAGRFCAFLIVPIAGLLVMEVVNRYVFNAPTVWANELSQMMFGGYAVLCGGYILLNNGHTNVDILVERFSVRTRAIIDICTFFVFFLFCGMLLYYGGSLAWDSLKILEGSESAWNPPIYIVKITIPLGAALLMLQGIAHLLKNILIVIHGSDVVSLTPGEEVKPHEH
ncbi:MAG: TRAP transporter small permease subunit [Thermodesulfobacteriota bacterium]